MSTNKKSWFGVVALLTFIEATAFIGLSFKSFAEVMPPRVVLGPIVRKGDRGTENYCRSTERGEICRMPQHTMLVEGRAPILGAIEYCQSLGGGHHLPNIYELAIGMSSDPEFVRLTLPSSQGYVFVQAAPDLQFFYDRDHHYRHSHENEPGPAYNWYWSSTPNASQPGSAYYFQAEHGEIISGFLGNDYMGEVSAVRCVESIQTQN